MKISKLGSGDGEGTSQGRLSTRETHLDAHVPDQEEHEGADKAGLGAAGVDELAPEGSGGVDADWGGG